MNDLVRIEILIRQLVHSMWREPYLHDLKERLHSIGIHVQGPILDRLYAMHRRSHSIELYHTYLEAEEHAQLEHDILRLISEIKGEP